MTEQASATKTLVVTFDAVADISSVGELHRHLCQALAVGQPVEFRARRCERMDTAVLQTVYAYHRAAKARGLPVSWSGVSPAVVDAAQRLGLAQGLGLQGNQ